MTVNQLLVFYNDFRSFINSNFTILFYNSLDEINGIVQNSVVYTMKHEQAAGLCWLSFWLILFNGTAIRLNQISAAHFRKFSTKIFFGQIFETGRRGLRIIRWRHQPTSSSYCCHKSIMSPFFLSRTLYFQRFSNWPMRMLIRDWPIRVQKTYLYNHHLYLWNSLSDLRNNHVM